MNSATFNQYVQTAYPNGIPQHLIWNEDDYLVDPNIQNIPPDLVFLIAGHIIKSAENIGVNDFSKRQREEAIRLRNKTLRSLSLTSRQAFHNWYPYLLSNFRIGPMHILYLYRILKAQPERGQLVRTLQIREQPERALTPTESELFNATLLHVQNEYTKDVEWKDEARKIKQHFKMAEEYALAQIDRLETLIISDRRWCFPVVSTLGGISTPFPFFNTLKRIHISQREAETNDLFAARNAIFILTFCPNLTQAALSFSLTAADYDYLSEYQEGYFQKSRVKQLAIAPLFFHNRRNTRFWMENKRFGKWKGGNKMTETIWNFLSVTNGLDSLEVVPNQTRGDVETTGVFTGCLSSLTSSYDTLKHLRLISVCPIEADNNHGSEKPYMDLSNFKNLKILGLNIMVITALMSWNSKNVPPNLETIQLICYDSPRLLTPGSAFQEEKMMIDRLQQLVQSLQLAKLKTVVVPHAPIDYSGSRPAPHVDVSGWSSIRNRSVNSPLFADGKVQLKALRPNEILGDESKGEVCLSSFGWIHSFCF